MVSVSKTLIMILKIFVPFVIVQSPFKFFKYVRNGINFRLSQVLCLQSYRHMPKNLPKG